MDEFQFKPLTEGLGFHKKKDSKASTTGKGSSMSFNLKNTQSSSEDLNLTYPLPRKTPRTETFGGGATTNTNTAVDDILKTLNEKRSVDFADAKKAKSALHEPPVATFKTSYFDVSAGILDAMLVVAAVLACLIVLLLVTQVDLVGNLTNPGADFTIYYGLLGLIASISWIYLVANRVFMGSTPGEWVFDQQLGTEAEQKKAIYGLKVAARSLLVIATGFIIFPILSLILQRDIIGSVFGLSLVKKN
jgi:hypothetical protein